MCAWGQAAAAIGSTLASGIGSWLSSKSTKGSSRAYSSAGGADLVGNITKIGSPSNFDWSKLDDLFKGIQYNLGDYAASAFDYYMADKAFQQQVDYNNAAMEKQYGYDKAIQAQSFDYSRQLQNEQNQWSQWMSNTSHQREVNDLRAAGLNPILSSNAGANAYSSGGAVMTGNAPSALGVDQPNYSSASANRIARQNMRIQEKLANAQAGNLAAQSLQALGAVGLQQAQINRLDAQTGNDFFLSMLAGKKANADIAKTMAEAGKIDYEVTNNLPALLEQIRSYTGSNNAQAEFYKRHGDYYGHLDMLLGDDRSKSRTDSVKVGPFSFSSTDSNSRY